MQTKENGLIPKSNESSMKSFGPSRGGKASMYASIKYAASVIQATRPDYSVDQVIGELPLQGVFLSPISIDRLRRSLDQGGSCHE